MSNEPKLVPMMEDSALLAIQSVKELFALVKESKANDADLDRWEVLDDERKTAAANEAAGKKCPITEAEFAAEADSLKAQLLTKLCNLKCVVKYGEPRESKSGGTSGGAFLKDGEWNGFGFWVGGQVPLKLKDGRTIFVQMNSGKVIGSDLAKPIG